VGLLCTVQAENECINDESLMLQMQLKENQAPKNIDPAVKDYDAPAPAGSQGDMTTEEFDDDLWEVDNELAEGWEDETDEDDNDLWEDGTDEDDNDLSKVDLHHQDENDEDDYELLMKINMSLGAKGLGCPEKPCHRRRRIGEPQCKFPNNPVVHRRRCCADRRRGLSRRGGSLCRFDADYCSYHRRRRNCAWPTTIRGSLSEWYPADCGVTPCR